MKYRKKYLVEAFQLKKELWIEYKKMKDFECIDFFPKWFCESLGQVVFPYNNNNESIFFGEIKTLEGNYKVTWNDFIIKGVKVKLYPCNPDIFEKNYEKVEKEENAPK